MRLGDLDALKEDLKQYFSDGILDSVSAKLAFNMILRKINNAPTVETDIEEVGKDAYKQGYTDGWKERFGEPNERPQGEFTDLEQKVIADSINYILGAELLEENGYTEEVVNALKSVLQKIGAEEDHL